MATMQTRIVLDKQDINRTLTRIAHEISERSRGMEHLVLIGIRRRGVAIAQRLSQKLHDITGVPVPVGALDITLYRDDLSEIDAQPVLKKTEIPFSVKGKRIILCDDVLYTGRTIRAALDGIIDLGRPMSIQLAVLIDRGHRELPIQADYTGTVVKTLPNQAVRLNVQEHDGEDSIWLVEKEKGD